eukprot:COSAG06_NODE_9647_length_1852_cov_1.118654_2_plen_439_part_01
MSFAAFICTALTPTDSMLAADDSVMCEAPAHRHIQLLSGIVIVLFSFGVPVVFGATLIRKAQQYDKETLGLNAALARRVAEKLNVNPAAAEYVIRDVVIGKDYSFIMDAYSPRYLYWEALDMIRKLFLVGLILLVGRGSIAQLTCAILFAFGFFALQVKVSPYKIAQDNTFRAATEFHVFIVIVCALVLEKTDVTREGFTTGAYDWSLFVTWVICIPGAFVVTVISKLRFVKRVLYGAQKGPRRAFDRCYVGLKNEADINEFKAFLEDVRGEVQGDAFTKVIEGKAWMGSLKASKVIHVGGLEGDDLEDEAKLAKLFGKFGTVAATTLRLRRIEEEGVRKVSWALISFATTGEADAAVAGVQLLAQPTLVAKKLDLSQAMTSTGSMMDVAQKHKQQLDAGANSFTELGAAQSKAGNTTVQPESKPKAPAPVQPEAKEEE